MSKVVYRPEFVGFGSASGLWDIFYSRPKAQEFVNNWRTKESLKAYLIENSMCVFFVAKAFFLMFDGKFNKNVYRTIAKNAFLSDESLDLFIESFFTSMELNDSFKKTNEFHQGSLTTYQKDNLIKLIREYFLDEDENWTETNNLYKLEHNFEFICNEDVLTVLDNDNEKYPLQVTRKNGLYIKKGTVLELVETNGESYYEDKKGNSVSVNSDVLNTNTLSKILSDEL